MSRNALEVSKNEVLDASSFSSRSISGSSSASGSRSAFFLSCQKIKYHFYFFVFVFVFFFCFCFIFFFWWATICAIIDFWTLFTNKKKITYNKFAEPLQPSISDVLLLKEQSPVYMLSSTFKLDAISKLWIEFNEFAHTCYLFYFY